MSKSKSFAPGRNDWSNGTTFHLTSSFAKPSSSATAYATALSKPLSVAGSFSFHVDPLGAPPSNQGG
jgi:hypothetical protein